MPSTPYNTQSFLPSQGRGYYPIAMTVNLADIAAADLITTLPIAHDFKVLGISTITTKAASTAAKAATLTAKITPAGGSATNVTGAVLAMTSANQTPAGKVNSVTATDILAGGTNRGNAGDSISLTASSVTAFVEGVATILIWIQDLDCA